MTKAQLQLITTMDIEYFTNPPVEVLNISDPGKAIAVDRVSYKDFYRAIEAIAANYQLSYFQARKEIIDYFSSQDTFSLYGICTNALRRPSSLNKITDVSGVVQKLILARIRAKLESMEEPELIEAARQILSHAPTASMQAINKILE